MCARTRSRRYRVHLTSLFIVGLRFPASVLRLSSSSGWGLRAMASTKRLTGYKYGIWKLPEMAFNCHLPTLRTESVSGCHTVGPERDTIQVNSSEPCIARLRLGVKALGTRLPGRPPTCFERSILRVGAAPGGVGRRGSCGKWDMDNEVLGWFGLRLTWLSLARCDVTPSPGISLSTCLGASSLRIFL